MKYVLHKDRAKNIALFFSRDWSEHSKNVGKMWS